MCYKLFGKGLLEKSRNNRQVCEVNIGKVGRMMVYLFLPDYVG